MTNSAHVFRTRDTKSRPPTLDRSGPEWEWCPACEQMTPAGQSRHRVYEGRAWAYCYGA